MLTIAREAVKTNRMDHLEALFKRYPDVVKETIVKADIQREGIQTTEAVLEYGKGLTLRLFQLFSWDMSPLKKLREAQPVRIPDTLYGFGGLYNLRRVAFVLRGNAESPYLVDILEGEPWVLDRGTRTPMIQLEPWNMRNPEWYFKTFVDGSRYTEYQALSVFRQCQYWGPEEECKYCDINENARTKKMLGQVLSIQPQDPRRVAEVLWNSMYLQEDECESAKSRRIPYSTTFSGGTILAGHKMRGMTDDQFYERYAVALRERAGGKVNIKQHSTPFPTKVERRLKASGVNCRSSNFEVWDPRMFHIICPGKDHFIGRDEWIRRVINQVGVYGVGNVTPGVVAGVEMAQPWGFKTVEEAVASTTQGMDFLMRHGAFVRVIQWCVEALSALAGQTPPPVDYFIQIDRNWWEIYNKYDLPPLTWNPIGPGRNIAFQNGGWDMEWVVEGR